MMDGSREYDLFVRQQPKQARMCGVGADRRPIDPPPIVQLRVIDKARKNLPSPSPSPPPQHHQQPSHPHAHTHESSGPLDTSMLTPAGFGAGPFLQNPYYFMFASLAKPDDDTELHWMKDGKTRCTTGSVVSSLYHLKDSENDNRDAGFFVFPDLSVRQEGSYRLKLSLFEVVGSNVYHCKSIFSSPFYVYTAKKFPGMEESTALSCSLADQGIKIRIRKDIRQRKPRSGTMTFPITNGQPLGPGIPIQDDESDRESEVRHDDHSDTTNNHNSLSNITSKPSNGRKRPEREAEKDRERDLKRPRVDGDEGEPTPNPAPSTGEWGIDPALAPGGSSSSYDHARSTASVPPPPPSAPGYPPPPPPPQHHTYDPPPPPPQHHPQPAHHTTHPPQHQPPHHYSAPPPQSVHPTHHPTHPPPPPPYHTQYPSSWPPPQHPQHPPPPHQYDHYQPHYPQYPPPPRYASTAYDPYGAPPQQQSVPTYPATGYYAQYGRPGEAYGQYAPPPPPPPAAPGPEGPNSASRNPPAYGQYQPPPPQQPPPPPGTSSPTNPSRTPSYSYPAQPPPTPTENGSYPPQPQSAPAAPSNTGGRASTGPTAPAPPPGAGAASVYYQSHAQSAPRGYGSPPPNAYPPAPYHPQHPPPPPAHHASPGHYPPYQHPSHPPPPHQGTWGTPNYPPAPAPAVYPGQSPNPNGGWEGSTASGHSSVPATARENGPAAAPAANTSISAGGPGLQLAPLRARDDRVERERDVRPEIKDERDRRKDDREPWGGRLGGGAPSSLGAVSRPERVRKRLSIGSMLADEQ